MELDNPFLILVRMACRAKCKICFVIREPIGISGQIQGKEVFYAQSSTHHTHIIFCTIFPFLTPLCMDAFLGQRRKKGRYRALLS